MARPCERRPARPCSRRPHCSLRPRAGGLRVSSWVRVRAGFERLPSAVLWWKAIVFTEKVKRSPADTRRSADVSLRCRQTMRRTGEPTLRPDPVALLARTRVRPAPGPAGIPEVVPATGGQPCCPRHKNHHRALKHSGTPAAGWSPGSCCCAVPTAAPPHLPDAPEAPRSWEAPGSHPLPTDLSFDQSPHPVPGPCPRNFSRQISEIHLSSSGTIHSTRACHGLASPAACRPGKPAQAWSSLAALATFPLRPTTYLPQAIFLSPLVKGRYDFWLR